MTQNSNDNNKKMEHLKSLEDVIYPEIEPGIISKQMIEKAYLEEQSKGDEAKQQQFDPSTYERVTSLRLDFKSKNHLKLKI